MGKTPIYKLGYFEPNQDIGAELDLDELRFKATEIRELERMDIVEFFSYYSIFEKQLEKKLDKK